MASLSASHADTGISLSKSLSALPNYSLPLALMSCHRGFCARTRLHYSAHFAQSLMPRCVKGSVNRCGNRLMWRQWQSLPLHLTFAPFCSRQLSAKSWSHFPTCGCTSQFVTKSTPFSLAPSRGPARQWHLFIFKISGTRLQTGQARRCAFACWTSPKHLIG